jgi:hypothetical protein
MPMKNLTCRKFIVTATTAIAGTSDINPKTDLDENVLP